MRAITSGSLRRTYCQSRAAEAKLATHVRSAVALGVRWPSRPSPPGSEADWRLGGGLELLRSGVRGYLRSSKGFEGFEETAGRHGGAPLRHRIMPD